MNVSREEDDMEVDDARLGIVESDAQQQALFGIHGQYAKPSAYIKDLIKQLPSKETLTRDQTLFMARFAHACDEAWSDQEKPPCDRKVHHLLLLGEGGSGKTHVVQKLVFKAVQFIWPAPSEDEPTLMVTASSNAQAKNISNATIKARTLHNATGMRVQKYLNPLMRPGNKLKQLSLLWGRVQVLVIEEISLVAAANYNMLDFRSMHGRSKTHDVCESNYRQQHHHFGRVPIVR